MTCSPFFMAKNAQQSLVDLIVEARGGGIEPNQSCESLGWIGPVRGGGQLLVHRTNHSVWNSTVAGAVPSQALVQRCLKPPAEPLKSPRPQVPVHQPAAPTELRMGRIHKHVVTVRKGIVDGPMEQRLQFRPWALNARISPQLLPEVVAGDDPCAEQRSEGCGKGGLSTARGTDQQMALERWFRQRTVCTAIAPAHQSQEQERTLGQRNRNNPGDLQSFRPH